MLHKVHGLQVPLTGCCLTLLHISGPATAMPRASLPAAILCPLVAEPYLARWFLFQASA